MYHLPRFIGVWGTFALAATAQSAALAPPLPGPPGMWRPVPGTSWQIQYTGALNLALEVEVFNLDLFDTSAEVIAALRAEGKRVMCYFSAGSYEEWRPDAPRFPRALLGRPLEDWPGERWLDIRRGLLLRPLMAARLDLAAAKGCDGVDPDNVDGYTQATGFALTARQQLGYNTWLANAAHARGLAVGLKNDLAQVAALLPYFDWAVNEQCLFYDECELLLPFIDAGKPVFGIEYAGNPSAFCSRANALNFDTLKKRLSLDAWRRACR